MRPVPDRPALPIRSADYKVICTGRMTPMREFYGSTLGLTLNRRLGSLWVEYRVGTRLLALASSIASQLATSSSARIAFGTSSKEMERCAALLAERGVDVLDGPAGEPWERRVLLFRDPDRNIVEIHADAE